MSEVLAMGGYGAYVWSSFGLAAVVLLACVWQSRSEHRRVCNEIRAALDAMEGNK